MKEFVSHIDYLIQKHDCVIIPDFGGFVLSHEGASIAKDGTVLPPKITVGFNPGLRSNDGLLAESYMNVYSIPYEEACKKIQETVKRLNTILGMRHPVQIGRLGKLSLDKNDRLSFIPNANLSIFHPDTFGLSAVNIRRLSDIAKDENRIRRKSLVQSVFAGAGAVAAAILVFFVASTPVSENLNTQKSSFFTDLVPVMTETVSKAEPSTLPLVAVDDKAEVSASIADITVPDVSESPVQEVIPEKVTIKDVVSENVKSENNYFVIIGGAGNNQEAQNLLNKFKSQGFDHADIVSSKTRMRIYVASFTTREEADNYLISFKKEHPRLKDAWVYYKD